MTNCLFVSNHKNGVLFIFMPHLFSEFAVFVFGYFFPTFLDYTTHS